MPLTLQCPPTTLKLVKPLYCVPIELRSNVSEPGPAKAEGIVAGGFDVAADDIAGAERERVAASAELDCGAAGADDGSGVEHAGGLDTDQCDTGRARNRTGVADVARKD